MWKYLLMTLSRFPVFFIVPYSNVRLPVSFLSYFSVQAFSMFDKHIKKHWFNLITQVFNVFKFFSFGWLSLQKKRSLTQPSFCVLSKFDRWLLVSCFVFQFPRIEEKNFFVKLSELISCKAKASWN